MKSGYECKSCKFSTFDLVVRYRNKGEDLMDYINYFAIECSKHHRLMCPVCPSKHLDLRIPLSKDGIGFDGPEMTPKEVEDLKKQLEQP